MKTRLIWSCASALLPLVCLAAEPVPSAADAVHVSGVYVRAVPPVQPTSAAYLRMANRGAAEHALVAAESAAASAVELHNHIDDAGVMRMRRVPRIAVPAGGEVALAPGGLHLMLIGLTRPLTPGEVVDLTLIYEDGSREAVVAPVRDAGGEAGHHHHH